MPKVRTDNLTAIRLKRARKESGLSQRELADKLKLSDKAVSSYEVGRAHPSLETLKAISEITRRPFSYFVTESDPDEMALKIKLKAIESDLLEVKKLLRKKQHQD